MSQATLHAGSSKTKRFKIRTMDTPLRFAPHLRPMVWGARRLGELFGKALPSNEPYGESWDITDHPQHRSAVVNGPRAGQSLRYLMENCKTSLLGKAAAAHDVFPWLVKFLDASDWLSVQVHPDALSVAKLWPGEGPKTEAWFVLDALPGSKIYAGLLPGVDAQRLRQALEQGAVADCLHTFEPQPGDCVFLPAGTVHALGGGVMLAEVQQTSDATFRLFDWNRKDAHGKSRQLHVEQAMACIDWQRGPVNPIRALGFPGLARPAIALKAVKQPLVSCDYFDLSYESCLTSFTCGGGNRLGLLIVLTGLGTMHSPHGEESLTSGQAWVLPATMPAMTCRVTEPMTVLHCTLPG